MLGARYDREPNFWSPGHHVVFLRLSHNIYQGIIKLFEKMNIAFLVKKNETEGQKQPPEVFYEKSCSYKFRLTAQHLCWSLFLIKLQTFRQLY